MAVGTGARTEFIVEPGKQDLTIRQVFDAPRERVYKLYTNPKLKARWWGPREMTTKIDRMDVRRGGIWRHTQRDPQGKDWVFWGVYHDVVPPERIVDTFEWEGMPGHLSLQITTFKEVDGKTEATTKVIFQSVEDRDGMVNSGMERGVRESGERFAELLAHEK